jgi:DNA uptake protein ComE-like DNA-binding protein
MFALILLALTACGETPPPAPAEAPTPPVAEAPPAPAEAPAAPAAPAAPFTRTVNLNTATDAEITAGVPGIGKKMIHEFEEYRPYASILQFRKEMSKYVDDATIAEYEKFVFVPVDANQADAATLAQLPGVSAEDADALIKARPFANNDAFITALTDKVSPEELNQAKGMLKQ